MDSGPDRSFAVRNVMKTCTVGRSHVSVLFVSFLHTAEVFRYWGEGPTMKHTAFFCSSPLAFALKLASRHISALVSEFFTNWWARVPIQAQACSSEMDVWNSSPGAKQPERERIVPYWFFFALTTLFQLQKLRKFEW